VDSMTNWSLENEKIMENANKSTKRAAVKAVEAYRPAGDRSLLKDLLDAL
jgi:hypothetical protein